MLTAENVQAQYALSHVLYYLKLERLLASTDAAQSRVGFIRIAALDIVIFSSGISLRELQTRRWAREHAKPDLLGPRQNI